MGYEADLLLEAGDITADEYAYFDEWDLTGIEPVGASGGIISLDEHISRLPQNQPSPTVSLEVVNPVSGFFPEAKDVINQPITLDTSNVWIPNPLPGGASGHGNWDPQIEIEQVPQFDLNPFNKGPVTDFLGGLGGNVQNTLDIAKLIPLMILSGSRNSNMSMMLTLWMLNKGKF